MTDELELFRIFGWNAIELRYGSKLGALFGRPGGKRLRARLDAMPYAEYQSLLRLPAAAASGTRACGRTGAWSSWSGRTRGPCRPRPSPRRRTSPPK